LTSGGVCAASHFCCFQYRKCDASDEFTTSTFLIPDWCSWLMRWNTRSDPERSTSTSILGYAALKAWAIASATLTSTDEYQTTLPSFAAASSIAGVVSCASAGIATAPHVSSPDISKRAIPVIRLPPRGRAIVMRNQPCSFGEAAAKLGIEAYANTRF